MTCVALQEQKLQAADRQVNCMSLATACWLRLAGRLSFERLLTSWRDAYQTQSAMLRNQSQWRHMRSICFVPRTGAFAHGFEASSLLFR